MTFFQNFVRGASLLSFSFSVLIAPSLIADEVEIDHCEQVKNSVVEAGFADTVHVHCDDHHAYLTSDSYPDHPKMTGITATNEQVPTPAPGYSVPVLLQPEFVGEPQTRDAALAVAVNGVPIFDYTAGGEMSEGDLYHHQPHLDTLQNGELDHCGGHAGRGDDYHYHRLPNCMIDEMPNAGDDAVIAWAFDGYPLYGYNNPDGSEIAEGDLDVCNGQFDALFGYRYHASESSPYILQCLMGTVPNWNALPRIGTSRPSGRPPRGGVENLEFVEEENGAARMNYEYMGQDYYINYEPAERENCFHFEYKTVTSGGEIKSGEYCSNVRTGDMGR